MPAKRYPLPKKMNLSLSEKAYANLRRLNEQHHYGNNYLLTILLENIDDVVDGAALDHAFARFKEEFGAPAAGGMMRN
jgi:DTW domain-containing protein YfiP